jgi:hypothetical protein
MRVMEISSGTTGSIERAKESWADAGGEAHRTPRSRWTADDGLTNTVPVGVADLPCRRRSFRTRLGTSPASWLRSTTHMPP